MNKILASSVVALLFFGSVQDTLGYGRGGASSSPTPSYSSVSPTSLPQGLNQVNVYTNLRAQIRALTNLPMLISFLEPYLKTIGGQKIGTKKVTGKADLKKLRDALKAISDGNATTATKKVTAALKVFTNDYFSKDPLSRMTIEQAVTILGNSSNFPQMSPVYPQVQQLLPNLKMIVANDKA